jgi:hypothetical protein
MKWKVDEKGNIVVNADGNPIALMDKEGKEEEVGIDVDHLWNKVPELQTEAKNNRLKYQALEKDLKTFEGIDPEKAKKALDITANLDAKKMVDANEMENLKKQLMENHNKDKEETVKSFEGKLQELSSTVEQKDSQIFNLMVSEQFSKSDFFGGAEPRTTLPPEVAVSYFGKYFKVEPIEGTDKLQVVGYMDEAGKEKIYSKSKPGAFASFNEALNTIIEKSPFKDKIIRASTGGGDHNPSKTNNGGVLRLSPEQARDTATYRAAKDRAAKEGLEVVLSDA